jgi:hypothetical protein
MGVCSQKLEFKRWARHRLDLGRGLVSWSAHRGQLLACPLVARCEPSRGSQVKPVSRPPLETTNSSLSPGGSGLRRRSGAGGGAPGWTNGLDAGEDRRSVGRRWAWFDPVAKSRVRGC